MPKKLLLLTFIICHNILGKVTVNDMDVAEILKSGDCITYKISNENEKENNITVFWNNEKITIGSIDVSKAQMDSLTEAYSEIAAHGPSFISKAVNMQAGTTFKSSGKFYKIDNEINIGAQEKLESILDIFQAQAIYLLSNQIEINSFAQTKILQIESLSKDSIIQIIQFKFADDSEIFNAIECFINFNNQSINNNIVVLNAISVTIKFNENIIPASTNKKPLSHITPTETEDKHIQTSPKLEKNFLQKLISWLYSSN